MSYPTKLPGLLTVLMLCLVLKCMAGCAQRSVVAPSTAGIREQVQSAQNSNSQLGTNNTRMEHKAVIIDRWLETHP